ncbi:Hsp20/alpha crystallin family protein [Synechococcus sp. PCC 7336]|uniref:Hsp20/alpha crystallin family protein n=1 Tax=Synechococcus sp. PCC 7336 TaxID=195250 RepID=UPI0006880EE1|nr:Hsp20/alpha crystallin family protein [Synechococcus sp. PCC 7336]
MTMLTWYAMDEADRIRRQLDRLFEPNAGASVTRAGETLSTPAQVWETNESYIVRVMLPGVKAENLDIEAHARGLTISGHADFESLENATLLHSEFSNGQFKRSWKFARSIKTEAVSARHLDGLLSVTLPKEDVARTIKVAIENGQGNASQMGADSETTAELSA